jgi:hypothetical protein
MAVTDVWRASRVPARTSRPGRRRVSARLWALLHAPGLLQGAAADAHSAAVMEDDHRRFAAAPRGY